MIEFWGLKIHGYGLMIGLGIWLAWEIALRYGKTKPQLIEKIAPMTIFWGIVGARAYHVVDLWEYYSTDLIKVFYLWNGGLGIWGAILGGLGYLIYFSKKNKVNFYEVSDSIVLGLPLAQAVGRVGNFINKELYGKNGEPLFAWEGGLNILLFGILMYISGLRTSTGMTQPTRSTKFGGQAGFVTGAYLVGYGLIRILLENFRSDEIIWRLGGVPVAIAIGIVATIAGLVIVFRNKKTDSAF